MSVCTGIGKNARIKTTWALMFDCAFFGSPCLVVGIASLRCCLQIAWVLRGCYGFLCFQWPAESNCRQKSLRTSTPLSYSARCGRLFFRRFGLSSRFLLVHRTVSKKRCWIRNIEVIHPTPFLHVHSGSDCQVHRNRSSYWKHMAAWKCNSAANRMARAISTIFFSPCLQQLLHVRP